MLPVSALVPLLKAVATQRVEQAASAQQTISGQEQGDLLFRTARSHMGVSGATRRVVDKDDVRETDHDFPDGGRFATVRLSPDGKLAELSVNSPDDGRAYRPIIERGAFVRRVIDILSPDASSVERECAVALLDNPARQWTPSFPIVVRRFVYRLYRANLHDHFKIASADSSTPGWRYGWVRDRHSNR